MIKSPIEKYLKDIYTRFIMDKRGEVADYIPELAKVNPDKFAIVLATADGQVYKYGDTDQLFTIQSISKPFTYALAISDNGFALVDKKIDVEPSGDAFNEISLDARSNRPKNGMINSGAITSTSLVKGRSSEERYERIRKFYSDFAGRELHPDFGVFQSESETGHRNRAIAWMLKNFGIIEGNPEEVLAAYFEQCSTLVNTEDLALMAATLANDGIHPLTKKKIVSPEIVERVLSVMMTAGMYDGAGDWMTSVGLPAKSGVGGGIIGVLPGQLAIAVFSPRLDNHGNSIRGVKAFEAMSRELHLHIMNIARAASSAIRAIYTIDERPSILRRTKEEEDILIEYGPRAKVIEAQGDILFSGAEKLIRESLEESEGVDTFIYDITFVDSVADGDSSDIVRSMLYKIARDQIEDGKSIAIIDPKFKSENLQDIPSGLKLFKLSESALQWAENQILDKYAKESTSDDEEMTPLKDFEFFDAFSEQERDRFIGYLEPIFYPAKTPIFEPHTAKSGIYFIMKGRISVELYGDREGLEKRIIAVLMAGMTIGEYTLIHEDSGDFSVKSQTDSNLFYLSNEAIKRISQEDIPLSIALWKTVARSGYELFDRTMYQLSARIDQELKDKE
ncbi:glutaminase A [Streptococcaceae bacterium ESL0729]|nr:glutaminase A [Streptococcaceae bacterium ESL0729]